MQPEELADAAGSAWPAMLPCTPAERSLARGHRYLAMLLPMVVAGPICCNGARFHHAGLQFNRSGCRFEHEILAWSIEVRRTMSPLRHPQPASDSTTSACCCYSQAAPSPPPPPLLLGASAGRVEAGASAVAGGGGWRRSGGTEAARPCWAGGQPAATASSSGREPAAVRGTTPHTMVDDERARMGMP